MLRLAEHTHPPSTRKSGRILNRKACVLKCLFSFATTRQVSLPFRVG